MSHLSELTKLATAKGLQVKDCGMGHYQIIGGPMLVNYWPDSKRRTAYVGATREGKTGVTPAQAVGFALTAPPVRAISHQRKGHYRQAKIKMFRKQKTCRWCHCQLSLDGEVDGTLKATLEHVIPLKRGGLDNANNYALACEPCNNKRGHNMPELGVTE